jgi:O-antigen/teichoic acid export membrane protein
VRHLAGKMPVLSAPVKSAVWFVICSMLQKGIFYLTMPVFTRLLTTEQYGVYTMYQSWFSIITIVCTLNLSYNVFHRAMVKYADDKDGYTSSMQGLVLVITLIVFSTFLFFPEQWESALELPDELVFCMFLEMLLSPAFFFWATRQRFEYRYVALVIVSVSITVIGTGLGVAAVILTDGGALARIYPVVGVDAAVGAFFMVLQYSRGRKFFSLEYWKFALAFNLPLMPHYLSTVALNQADRLMIGRICGFEDAAVYGVAYSVAMAMTLFVTSVNSSLIPWTYKQLASSDMNASKRIGQVGTALSAALAAFALLVVGLGPELMLFLAPESYREAIWVIPPVGLAVLATMYMWLFVNVETYYGKNMYVAAVSIGAALLNIVLNAITLPVFGFLAAGWTTLASYATMVLGHYAFMRHLQRCNGEASAYRVGQLLIIAAVTCVFSLVFMALYEVALARYVLIVVLCIAVFLRRKRLLSIFVEIKGSDKNAENLEDVPKKER